MIESDSLNEDEDMIEDKEECFVHEPLDTKYLPRVIFSPSTLFLIEVFSGRSKFHSPFCFPHNLGYETHIWNLHRVLSTEFLAKIYSKMKNLQAKIQNGTIWLILFNLIKLLFILFTFILFFYWKKLNNMCTVWISEWKLFRGYCCLPWIRLGTFHDKVSVLLWRFYMWYNANCFENISHPVIIRLFNIGIFECVEISLKSNNYILTLGCKDWPEYPQWQVYFRTVGPF